MGSMVCLYVHMGIMRACPFEWMHMSAHWNRKLSSRRYAQRP